MKYDGIIVKYLNNIVIWDHESQGALTVRRLWKMDFQVKSNLQP